MIKTDTTTDQMVYELYWLSKQIILASFKSGLNKNLLNHIDGYIELDEIYFE